MPQQFKSNPLTDRSLVTEYNITLVPTSLQEGFSLVCKERSYPNSSHRYIVIGDFFSQGHVARAICRRSQVAPENFEFSPPLFQLEHSKIVHWPLNSNRHEQVKKSRTKESINWALGDKKIEK
mmetsp:Transcript_6529/g.9985  ORF Transcript_6529/g.9985 Transcript_6529/m.9985 type:complete len:123 (-) Transcript_6529:2837-3205(-)